MRNKRKAFIIMIMVLTLSVSLIGCNSKGNVSVDNEGPTEESIDDNEDTKDEDSKDDFNLIQFSAKIVGEKSLQVILLDKASDEDRFVEVLAHLYHDGDLVAEKKGDPKGDTVEFEMPIVKGDIIHVVVNNDLGWKSESLRREGTNDALFVVGADSQLEEISYTTQTTSVSGTDDAIPFSIVVDNPYTIRINSEDDRADRVLVKVRRGDEYLVLFWATPQEKPFRDKTSLFVLSEVLLEGDVVEVTVNSDLDFESYGTAVIKAFNDDLPNPGNNKEEDTKDNEDTKDKDAKDDFNLIQFSAKIVGEKSLQVILPDEMFDEDRFFETIAYLYRDGDLVAVQAGDAKGETDIIEFEMPIVEGDIIHVVVNHGSEGVDNTLFVIEGASNVLFVVDSDSQVEKIPYSTQSTFVPITDDYTVPFSIVVDNPYSIHINTDDDWVNQVLVEVRRGDEYLAPQENVLNGKNGETKTTLFVFSEGLLEGDVVEVTVDVGYKYESYGTAVIKDFNPIENP